MKEILDELVALGTVEAELELINGNHRRISTTLKTRILRVLHHDPPTVLIEPLIVDGQPLHLPTGMGVRVFFQYQNHLYGFIGKVHGSDHGNNILILMDEAPRKMQRRQSFRVKCYLKAEYRSDTEIYFKKAVIRNLSATGASIVVEDNLSAETRLEVQVWLSPSTPLRVKAQVVRNLGENIQNPGKYDVGLAFENLTSKDEDQLVKFLLNHQRQTLRETVG